MEVSQKIKNRVTLWPGNPSSGYVPEKFEDIYLQRHMHPYVHCSIIHGGHDLKTTKASLSRRLDKENGVPTHKGTLLGHKERWDTAICDDMMSLEDIRLSEVSQTETVKNYMMSLICGTSNWEQETDKQKLIGTDNSMVVTQGSGWGE